MAQPSLVIVLLEDSRQQQLVHRYLRRVGLNPHAMRFVRTSSGSGEQWVREQFTVEVGAYRRRCTHAETRLIAVMDADTFTVTQRVAQLDRKLGESLLAPIDIHVEQIARLIPRRNIETWLLCLNAIEVNEEEDYKRSRDDWTELVRPAAETLYAWTRQNAKLPNTRVPSLLQGVAELRRLDFGL